MKKNIIVFDTTLRDGEQSPGCQLNTVEKIEVAKALDVLGVDVIEAGFPFSSPGDLLSVQEITKVVTRPVIAALSRAIKGDIDAAVEALKFAKHKRIHTFISSSDIHIIHQFKSTREKILAQGIEAIKYAKQFAEDIEFSAMDAGRTENEFLAKFVEEAIKAGATTINIPDTTGYCLPDEFGAKIQYLFDHVKGIEDAIISVHCHNDLGMATANAITAVQHGARQIEVTVNGVGERAGNTALEEAVMILKTRQDLNAQTKIDTTKIHPISRLVSRLMKMPVQANKAIVGRNAFAHSSGIHQNGILKNRFTYEIMNPEDVGISMSSLSLTARSGRAALQHHLQRLGYKPTTEELVDIYNRFLVVADKKKDINDNDLRLLMGEKTQQTGIKLISVEVVSGTGKKPRASVSLKINGEYRKASSYGNGPIDAALRAINKIVQKEVLLEEFLVQAMTGGSDDMGKVHIQIQYSKNFYQGFGTDTDIIVAGIKAYIDAINKIL
jgi:2-isopropylmalate synthase